MPNRQRVLLIVFVVGLTGYLGYQVYQSQIVARFDDQRQSIERARRTATARRTEVVESRAAKLQLQEWQRLSLPPDPNEAVPKYQAFLLDLLEQCGFREPTITPGTPSLREQTYWRIPFEVRTRGSLESLVTFLDGFYRTRLLHTITQLNLTPANLQRREGLELSFSVEALALTADAGLESGDATARSGASESNSAASGPFAQVLQRNLLMRNGPGPARRPEFQATQVYLTGTLVVGDQPEALFYDRTTGRTLILHPGDPIGVGNVNGRVVDVGINDVILEIEKQWYQVALGDHLGRRRRLSASEALEREIQRPESTRPREAG